MEHTYDSVGHKKEVIVIDDSQTPEHPPRKRTRAQVAAENAAIAASRGHSGYGNGTANGSANGHLYNNGTTAHSVASTSSAGKKRKVDEGSDPAKKKGKVAVSLAELICWSS
jgi:dual-specificity kinase